MLNGEVACIVQGIQRRVYTSIVFDPNVPKFTLVYGCHHFMTIFTCFLSSKQSYLYISKNNNAIVCFMIILFVIAIAKLLVNYINYNQFKQDNESVCFRGCLQ